MFKISIKIITILVAIALLSQVTFARNNISYDERNKFSELEHSLAVDSIDMPVIKFPSHLGILQTGKLNTTFTDEGQFGKYFSAYYDPTISYTSFETPAFSGHEYLYGGAIWIGAVVDGDTLVTVGADGWDYGGELGFDNKDNPTVERIWYPSDYSMRAEYTDTVTDGTSRDYFEDRRHSPLNLKIVNRSHLWRNDTLDNAVFYDFLIDYIGPNDALDSVYIGFYFDSDIPAYPSEGYADDLTGSIRDNSLVYSIDNDGDHQGNIFNENSLTKTFAFELLSSSFNTTDTNFNWWVSSSTTEFDFGPRLKGTPEDPFRNFSSWNYLGTPSGDVNKYYMLRHKEWDYDQIYTASITTDDSLWLFPDSTNSIKFAKSGDTKFLFSMGPIRLEKGKSERIIIANFTAEAIHTVPYNINNIPDYPDTYKSNLGLENLISESADIKHALNILLDPRTPPTGLQVYDYNKIRFDQWGFDDVTGHELYATPIDVSTFPFPGTVPPWHRPSSPTHIGSSISEVPLNVIDGLTAVQVAYNSASGIGELSQPAFIFNRANLNKLIVKHSFNSTVQDSILLEWSLPENATQPDYYKIYKYATISEFENIYTKPYYLEGGTDAFTTDSISVDGVMWYYQSALEEQYAIVNGNELQFIDRSFDNDYLYFIISVDKNGFESEYALTYAYLVPERIKDFLIITKTRPLTLVTNTDTIISYYHELLNGTEMSYDIYSVNDSLINSVCRSDSLDFCPTWKTMSKYKYVIIDDSEFSNNYWTEEIIPYMMNGGNLINFGVLSNLLNVRLTIEPDWYPVFSYTKDFSIFGIDSIFHAGFAYNNPDPIEQGKFGFNIANSIDARYPSLECDTLRYPLDSSWNRMVNHHTNEPLEVSGFLLSENSSVTHTYNSLYPSTSFMEGLPVGVFNFWNDGFEFHEVYTFGFHLYYMKYAHARDLLRSIVSSVATDITEFDSGNLPTEFKLSQNYPNPFNPTTTIEFNIPTRTNVALNIYNLLGQQVNQLVDQDYAAGNYRVTWDGTNHAGEKVSSGIYLYRLETDDYTSTKKMLLLK